jgi:hypothetical protein
LENGDILSSYEIIIKNGFGRACQFSPPVTQSIKRMKYILFILIFLILASLAMAGENYECIYYQNDAQDLVTEKSCLTYTENVRNKDAGGDALISKKVADSALYDENGIGFLYSPVGVFYFTKSGLARKTMYFDNGPDYFSEGLARTEWNGKIGFFDKKLSIVIEPRFDFAFPFHNGLAAVCNGCTQKKLGEHTVIVGGKWGAINVKGEIVVPICHSKSELEAFLK